MGDLEGISLHDHSGLMVKSKSMEESSLPDEVEVEVLIC